MPRRGLRLWTLLGAATLAGVAAAAPGENELAAAQAALGRGDGIAAQVALDKALNAGAPRENLAAMMGEAWLDQGELKRAREWLGGGEFAPGTELRGYRMLGRLERQEGNLGAAGAAYDRALAVAPNNSALWVDIARLRYAGGEHLSSLAAAEKAVALDGANSQALLLRGQMVRDAFGPAAALPWFEAALAQAPDDLETLGEFAATLGEADRPSEMLAIVRRLHEIDPNNPRGFFLQAVLAARAGNFDLARGVLNRIKGGYNDAPAVLLLRGGLELEAGNSAVAADLMDRLVRLQPANRRAQHLLAQALLAEGEFSVLVNRLAPLAAQDDATPYLLTAVAMAYEAMDKRDLAAPLLDRAAHGGQPGQSVASDDGSQELPGSGAQLRGLLRSGQGGAALAMAERLRADQPGSGDVAGLLGDALTAAGRPGDALARYRDAAKVRFNEDLLLRIMVAEAMAGRRSEQDTLVAQFHAGNPASRLAVRLAVTRAAQRGDWAGAIASLESLVARGGQADIRLLCDLSFAQLRSGDENAAVVTAERAYRLQPASAVASQALGMALAASGQRPRAARSLLDKARKIAGDNPLLAEARDRLNGS